MVTGYRTNSHNLKNVRRKTSRYPRNKRSEYSKVKIKGLKTEGKNRNIGGLYKNEFQNRSQPRANLVKYATRNLNADSHIVLNRWKNYFFKSLNVFLCNDINHTKIHRAVPLVRLTLRWLLKS